jgi:autotransporter-associated beta strand protein
MANTYAGGTVVSNGVLRVGTENAISKTGTGDVAVYGSGILDLGGLNNAINGLVGNGHVDVQNGGSSILTVGNNDRDGLFSGTISNTYGTLALTKTGNGAQTLSGANTFSGGTTVEAGTVVVASSSALGTGGLTINGGTVDLRNNITLSNLAGSSGFLLNNTTGTTNMVVVQASTDNIFYGSVNNGTNGQIALTVLGAGSLRLNSANSYNGGTFVGSGSRFLIGNGSGAYVTGPLFASNNATLGLPGGSSPPGTPTSITTVDGAMVLFTSGAEGNIWGGQFIGSATATNRFIAPVSSSATLSFSNFLGVVQFANTNSNNNFRFFNGTGVSGGENTTFEFEAGNVHTRDAQTICLGAIRGGSSSCGIGGASTAAAQDTYIIGAKNLSTVFAGYFNGSNNLVKAGTGRLDMTGLSVTTNTDGATYTNLIYAPIVTHVGYTTVSNGVLALLTPNNFSNSLSINLAGSSAVLDASKMGFVTNFTNPNGEYSELVTNGVLDVLPAQTLSGIGTIMGHVEAASGSILSVGLPTGVLSVTNGVALTETTVRMNLNRTNASTSSRLAATGAGSIVVNGGTLTVTNLGTDLVTGDVFQLFNKAITGTGFTGISLPVSNALNTIQYAYETNLAANGSIKVLVGVSPVDPNPTNITYTVSGSQLTLAWPASHTGWTLQAQTNSLNVGISNNWVDVPGSSTINSTNITINPANGAVFYRLKL